MSKPFTVAIVGRPNVGKSRLFNRLVGKRVSIVHDMPGVTRDVVTRDLDGYTLMDTGGMGLASGQSGTPQNLIGAVEAQVELALAAADFVLMVVDGREGLVPLDYSMADKLRDANKPVALVVNKVDTPDARLEIDDFFALGMGDPLLVSAEHDRGIPALKKAIYERRDAMAECAQEAPAEDRKVIRVCFIGRPNVGKSSLSNCLVQSDRFIVSETPGTTRDSVEMPFAWKSKRGEDWHFALTDTAGIRKKTKLDSSVEYFSRIRSLDAIREVDVVFLVLDAHEGPTAQDKAIAGEAVKANKPMVIVVNKWDLALEAWERGEIRGFDSEQGFRRAFEKGLRREIFFTPGSPIRFVSALQNYEIEKMLYDARQLDKRMGRKIPTGRLNNLIYKLAQRMPAPRMEGKRFRIYYSVHVGNRPYRFKLFCNQSRKLSDGYKRYLQAGIVEEFKLDGCPIVFNLVNKRNPYVEEGGR